MGKVKTTIYVDEELWRQFQLYVVKTTGSARKISEILEKAIREYLEHHAKEA